MLTADAAAAAAKDRRERLEWGEDVHSPPLELPPEPRGTSAERSAGRVVQKVTFAPPLIADSFGQVFRPSESIWLLSMAGPKASSFRSVKPGARPRCCSRASR